MPKQLWQKSEKIFRKKRGYFAANVELI